MIRYNLFFLTLAFFCMGCSHHPSATVTPTDTASLVRVPFNGDSAYAYCQRQVDFGPRVPGAPSHQQCVEWMVNTCKTMGANVSAQTGKVTRADGVSVDCHNVMARVEGTDTTRRVVIMAHYDCRPWADQDPDASRRDQPIAGANDGASGVAVMIEMMRVITTVLPERTTRPTIDFVFVDDEDMGEYNSENGWCLGSDLWARWARESGYRADYGILLDMVGAEGATFPKEAYSMRYAAAVTSGIWHTARQLGHGAFFRDVTLGNITDDHVKVNQIANIPMTDVIHYDERGFGYFWHTHADDMRNISPTTLQAVGETILTYILTH